MAFGLQDLVLSIAGDVRRAVDGLKSVASGIQNIDKTARIAAGNLISKLAYDALGAVTSAGRQAAQAFQDFELTIARIVAASGETGRAANELKNQLETVSKEQVQMGFSAREAAAGLEALVKAGMTGEQAATALKSALSFARIESIGTSEASNLLVQSLTMFHKSAEQSEEVLTAISKAADAGIDTATGFASGLANAGASAANMGLSLEETLAALIQLDKTFGGATESGTYLNALFKDLVAKSSDLNISLYNADGSMKNLDDIVQQLRNNVDAYGGNQERINQYLSAFDIRAQRAAIGLINYEGSISQTLGEMENQRGVQDKVNMMMETSAGRLAKLRAEQENLSESLGIMSTELDIAWKQMAVGLGPIGAVADTLGPSLLQGAMSGLVMLLPQIVSGLISAGGASQIAAAGMKILNVVMNMNPIFLVITAVGVLIYALWEWEKRTGALSKMWESFCKAVSNFYESYIKPVVDGIMWFIDLIKGAVEAIGSFGKEVAVGTPSVGMAANPRYASTTQQININQNSPLVNIEGSADRKTIDQAVWEIDEKYQTVIIDATSSGAPTKSIRK